MLPARRPLSFPSIIQRVSHLFQGGLAGVGWMLLACLFFSLLAIFVKSSKPFFYFPEILFYRNLPTVLILAIVMPFKGHSLKTHFPKAQLYRATFGGISMALSFLANLKLPLALAMTLSYTTPIFLALLTLFWYKQRLGKGLIFCIFMGFAGVLVLLRPTGMASNDWVAGLMGLCSGLFAALAYTNIQLLSRTGEPEWRTVFYFGLICGCYSGLATLIFFGHFHSLTFTHIKLIIGLGASGFLGQLCVTRAFSRGNPNVTSLFSYSTILLSSCWGWLFFGESLDAISLIGGTVVLASGILASWLKRSTK